MYVFFYQPKRVKTQRESKVMHECEGNREKSPNRVFFCPILFCYCSKKDSLLFSNSSKDSPTCWK